MNVEQHDSLEDYDDIQVVKQAAHGHWVLIVLVRPRQRVDSLPFVPHADPDTCGLQSRLKSLMLSATVLQPSQCAQAKSLKERLSLVPGSIQ